MKACFKCGKSKPIDEFYRHAQMADGHLNKCKDCTKTDVAKHYRDTIEDRTAYERERFQRPERKKAILRYARKRNRLYPEKLRARAAVARAIRNGGLHRQPCEVCGAKRTQAHHDDYSKPLTVRWLCYKHHLAVHGREKR